MDDPVTTVQHAAYYPTNSEGPFTARWVVPSAMSPGQSASSRYRMNAHRGAKPVDRPVGQQREDLSAVPSTTHSR